MGYPTRDEIGEIFAGLANGKTDDFLSHVSPDVTWDVLGDDYAAGHFTTSDDWKEGALDCINKVLREPLQLRIHNIIGGGQEWATVELKADAVCKNGMEYN
ncbi:hypothetical protein BDV97DRAFT_394824 [Delphinella strobiligena]|nr:hypothetical protein BDV97DRAFT_394824 [Delphinella strobiligena]